MPDPIHVLQIEDSPLVVEQTRAMLADTKGPRVVLESAGSLAEYVNLKQITIDLENQGGNSVARPSQEMTVQLFRSQ